MIQMPKNLHYDFFKYAEEILKIICYYFISMEKLFVVKTILK